MCGSASWRLSKEMVDVTARTLTRVEQKKTKQGRPSKPDRMPQVGKGESGLDRFIQQIQKN